EAGGRDQALLAPPADQRGEDPEAVDGLGAEPVRQEAQRAGKGLGYAGPRVLLQIRRLGFEGSYAGSACRTALRVASTTRWSASSTGHDSNAPEARTCPPPPNSRASAFTSTAPLERNEIFTSPWFVCRNRRPTSTPSIER